MGDAVTWVWQGSLVALALAGVLRAALALHVTAAARHWICWLGLGVVLALPLVPALFGAVPAAAGPAAAAGGAVLTLPGAPAALVALMVAAWALAVAGGVARLMLDLRHLRWMKGRARPMPESRQRRLPLWSSVRNRGRRAELAVLDDHTAAAVLGLGRPMIVVPRALLDALTDAELDQVVAHEHAHVERRDDWTNLLQRFIAVPFGLHPAVWLIGRWIRRERELAADERVAVRTGAPSAYARCIARVAEAMIGPAAPRLASAAVRSRGEVARRVAYLLDSRRVPALRPSRWALGAAALLAAASALLIGGRAPAVELGADGAAATRVRVGPPLLPAPLLSAVGATRAPADPSRGGRPQPRVTGVRLPTRRAPEPLTATGLFVRHPPQPLQAAARSSGREMRRRSRAPLQARDLGLTAHHTLVAPVAGIAALRESQRTWAERTGTSLASWFAGAGRTTAGAFRDLGASLTRRFTGRR